MPPCSGRSGHLCGRPLPCRSAKGFALAAGGAFTGGPLGSDVVRLRGGFVTGFDHDSALAIGRRWGIEDLATGRSLGGGVPLRQAPTTALNTGSLPSASPISRTSAISSSLPYATASASSRASASSSTVANLSRLPFRTSPGQSSDALLNRFLRAWPFSCSSRSLCWSKNFCFSDSPQAGNDEVPFGLLTIIAGIPGGLHSPSSGLANTVFTNTVCKEHFGGGALLSFGFGVGRGHASGSLAIRIIGRSQTPELLEDPAPADGSRLVTRGRGDPWGVSSTARMLS
jgi:hypothetical protein